MQIGAELGKEAGQSGSIPPSLRIGWRDPRRHVKASYFTPLRWLRTAVREFTYRMRLALHAPTVECVRTLETQRRYRERQRLAEEYAQGYMAGWRECFETCIEAVEEELGATNGAWDVGGVLAKPEDPSRAAN
jgi:hypothetical protein